MSDDLDPARGVIYALATIGLFFCGVAIICIAWQLANGG